ncbi:MAG: cob(I)yrinic acid a,c-diamide adenosyltransferase [Halieaceae bacterium]
MGNRLSKIYTKTGDDGTTGLGDGSRIAKNHPRAEAMGNVDELNCQVGMLIAQLPEDDSLQAILERVQHDLFDLGGELAVPGYELIKAERVTELERLLDEYNEDLPALKNFILPGGSPGAAQAHLARAICRRAERSMVALHAEEPLNEAPRLYINRLSDLMFVFARVLSRRDGGSEVLWQQQEN